MLDPKIEATASIGLVRLIGGYQAAVVCILAGALAILSRYARTASGAVAMCSLQQALLLSGVWPVMVAIVNGSYADGTEINGHAGTLFSMFSSRGSMAIALDQGWFIILTILHTRYFMRLHLHWRV